MIGKPSCPVLRGGGRCKLAPLPTWIKQHLRLHRFVSNSPNGVRVQIWAALCAHLLVAIAKQRKHLPASLYEILQTVSVSALEQIPLEELFMRIDTREPQLDIHNQLEINYS